MYLPHLHRRRSRNLYEDGKVTVMTIVVCKADGRLEFHSHTYGYSLEL